ncbi:MAG: 5-(carboxyamino)imidazole ribonucleotide synthase [Solirubrobacterales bacterium]
MPPYVGIVGGGQLGRMLALAAAPLGVDCGVVDPSPSAGAGVAADHTIAAFDEIDALIEIAAKSDVVTFEFENVSAPALAAIESRAKLSPPTHALEASQDRLNEKLLFSELDIPIAPYMAVDSFADLESAFDAIAEPAILKTRRFGYDGKGQATVESSADLARAWTSVGESPSVIERRVAFERELSVIAVRSSSGEIAIYPPAENLHVSGILRTSEAPANLSESLTKLANSYVTSLLTALDYVGVLALELFELDGELIANEFAPRVHNSGHWTIDAAPTSQFENHIRAILDLPLGSTSPVTDCLMVNLIGDSPALESLLAVPGAHVHLYDKEPRPGRKLGHVTVTATDELDLATASRRVLDLVSAATV